MAAALSAIIRPVAKVPNTAFFSVSFGDYVTDVGGMFWRVSSSLRCLTQSRSLRELGC